MIVREEAEFARALEERISSDPWTALLFTGTMPKADRIPLESGIFAIPESPAEEERIRAA